MKIKYVCVLIVLALSLWGCVSEGMAAAADLTEGRLWIIFIGLLKAILYCGAAFVISHLFLVHSGYSSSVQKAFAVAVVAFIGTFASPLYTVTFEGAIRVTSYEAIAPRLEEFTRANFRRIQECGAVEDDGNSAVIVVDEVKACLKSSIFRIEDKDILLALEEQLKLIGHVIATESTPHLLIISSGKGPMVFHPEVNSKVYGIALTDLDGYRGRLAELVKRWR